MKRMALGVVFVAVLVAGAEAESITHGGTTVNMDFVNIGYAGNVANTADGDNLTPGTQRYGAVDYNYRIGMKEVTIEQFAAARAADNRISNGNEGYWNDGIRSVGTGGPASQVSVYEAMKFANWLTTGNAYAGAYQFNEIGMLMAVNRDAAGTVYVLPNEDEWYKAAYYKPVNDGSYSLYANGSDDVADLTHRTASGWNYNDGSFAVGAPDSMWESGFGGEEQNGTYDMMGNVWEWTESAYDGSLDSMTEDFAVRGGHYYDMAAYMTSSKTRYLSPPVGEYNEYDGLGFRVAAIPEPSSLAMIGLVSGCAVFIRRTFMI